MSKQGLSVMKLPKRPSRPPPAPPVPPVLPRNSSLTASYNSLNYRDTHIPHYGRAESEAYSEIGPPSVAYTTRSLQPNNFNCSTQSECEYFSTKSECWMPCSESYYPCQVSRYYPPPRHPPMHPGSYCSKCCQQSIGRAPPQPVAAPVPLERKKAPRPRLSISPMPTLTTTGKQSKLPVKCKPLCYKRLIEQHIERIFKYLKDRQKRFDECEAAIKAQMQTLDEGSIHSIWRMLVLKESSYLRSLRNPMSLDDFEKIAQLGCGYMGNVLLVQKKLDPDEILAKKKRELFAMKAIKKSQVFRENHIAHIMAERDILAEANNDWIVKLFYAFQDDKCLYLILEYIPGGDLMNLLYDKNVFPEEWAQFYIAEISLALQFVHDLKFIHRDVKPDNILIDSRGHIKLTDFGLCTGFRWTHDKNFYMEDTTAPQDISLEDHPTITKALTRRELEYSTKARKISVVGSPNYIAPEVLDQDRRDNTNERLCDWWSVGVILYEMVIGYCPFIDIPKLRSGEYDPKKDTPDLIQMRIVNWKKYLAFPSRDDPESPPLMYETGSKELRYISNETKSLIQGWICDPVDRLCGKDGIRDIQNHPFFRGIDWQNIREMRAPHIPQFDDEKDTRYFGPQSSEADGTLGGSNHHGMDINDFTYRSFWEKPMK